MLPAAEITDDVVRMAVSGALRLRVGRGRMVPSAAKLGDLIGEAPKTIENWIDGSVTIGARGLLKLIRFFGTGFGDEVLEPIGMRAIEADDADAGRAAEISATVRRIGPDLGRLIDLAGGDDE